MKKSMKQLSLLSSSTISRGFFSQTGLRFKSMMILPVRSENFERSHPFDNLKYNTQSSRQEFQENIDSTLKKGIEKFNQGKFSESETDFDIVINSFAGFETDNLTTIERRLLSRALTRKAEITTKLFTSSSWNIALSYAKMACEIDQDSTDAKEVYLNIKSEIDMDLNSQAIEFTQTVSNRT